MREQSEVARRWEGVFRPALEDPSIERSTHFVRALRTTIEELLPRALHGVIFLRIRAGVVESLTVRRNDVEMLDVTTFAFRRRLRQWVQQRTPSDWFGTCTVHVSRRGRVSHSVIARVFE